MRIRRKQIVSIGLGAFLLFSCSGILNTDGGDSTNKPDGNDQISSATSYILGHETPFRISTNGDVDFFKFTVTKAGVYLITVSNIPSSLDLWFNIFDKEHTSLFSRSPQSSDGTLISFGDQFALGDYYLKINSGWNMSSNQEMKLKIDYDLTDTLEVNGTFATSYMIELNRYYQATIFPAGDKDNYKFTLDSNQIVRIKLDSVSSRTSMGVRISDDENVEIGYRTSITNTAPLDWGIVLKKGTYTLNLYAGWNEYSTKPYRIIVTKDTTDPTEWNGDTASAVNLEFGQPIKAAIYPNADYDFFKFNLPIADTVKINVDSISSSLSNFRVYLFDSEMNQKDYASYPIDGSTSLKKFLNAGLYYLRIQSGTDYNWNHSLKKYVLTVNKSTI